MEECERLCVTKHVNTIYNKKLSKCFYVILTKYLYYGSVVGTGIAPPFFFFFDGSRSCLYERQQVNKVYKIDIISNQNAKRYNIR